MKGHLLHPWLPAHSKERKTINWRALESEKQFHELWYWFLRRELFLKSYSSFYRKEVKRFLFNKDTKINFKYNLSSLFGLKKKKQIKGKTTDERVEKEKAMRVTITCQLPRQQMIWEKWLALGSAPTERQGPWKKCRQDNPGQKVVFVRVEEGVM